ncbi:hypothetical protein [Wolbachia endosymbiont (group A) of Rhinocyllus conicus]|uniref:hypothetical protein n=1 Tax=Wolbachia endosymbiont (group A) of Rhinocyllus conicus TaxID=2954053 RepID=UPI002225D20E|nr:hypothetical protein [Wolbachia endosymbiont (group A) of Rhinocyllus conicus]
MFFLVTRWNDKVSVRRCHSSTPFSSSQCLFLCHPSSPFFVIPVPISLSSE